MKIRAVIFDLKTQEFEPAVSGNTWEWFHERHILLYCMEGSRVPEFFRFDAWLDPKESEYPERMRRIDSLANESAVIYVSDDNERLMAAKLSHRFSTVGMRPATGTINVDFFLSTPTVTALTQAVNFIENRLHSH